MRYHTLPFSPSMSIAMFPVSPMMRERAGQPMAFRDFVALPAARALLHKGVPVDIGGRAFDLLMALLRCRGAIVSKQEIMREVWPTTIVDDGNLRFQMTALRKLLGEDRDMIKTVTGRGYLLIDDRNGAHASDRLTPRWTLPFQGVAA